MYQERGRGRLVEAGADGEVEDTAGEWPSHTMILPHLPVHDDTTAPKQHKDNYNPARTGTTDFASMAAKNTRCGSKLSPGAEKPLQKAFVFPHQLTSGPMGRAMRQP